MGTLWFSRARVSASLTSSSLGGCTDLPPDESSPDEELLDSLELELSLDDELFELSLPSVSAELSLWPSLSSSGLLLSSSLGVVSLHREVLVLRFHEELSLEEESESDLFSSSSNMAWALS